MQEQKEFTVSENSRNEISEIKKDVSEIKQKTEQMFYALMGNELSKDGGLVKRIVDNEVEAEKLSLRIDSLAERIDIQDFETKKKNIHLTLVWSLSSVIITALILKLIDHFLK